jgi:hypothetical protein
LGDGRILAQPRSEIRATEYYRLNAATAYAALPFCCLNIASTHFFGSGIATSSLGVAMYPFPVRQLRAAFR